MLKNSPGACGTPSQRWIRQVLALEEFVRGGRGWQVTEIQALVWKVPKAKHKEKAAGADSSHLQGCHEFPPSRGVIPSGSWKDSRILRGGGLSRPSVNRGSSEREEQGVAGSWAQPGCGSCWAEAGLGSGDGLNIQQDWPGLPGPCEHCRSAFQRKGFWMAVENELEPGRELKWVSLHMYFFPFLPLEEITTRANRQLASHVSSKYLFLSVYILSTAVILHCRGSIHPCWTHSIRFRGQGWYLWAQRHLDNAMAFSHLLSREAHTLCCTQLTEREVEEDLWWDEKRGCDEGDENKNLLRLCRPIGPDHLLS